MKRNGISVEKKYVGRKEEIAGNRKIEKPSLSILSNCLSAHGIIVDVLLKISKRRLYYFKKKKEKKDLFPSILISRFYHKLLTRRR